MTTAKVKLDTWHKNCVVVSASQGEVNSRFLEITLVNGGVPLNLEGTTVLIYAKKPDGNVIFNNCTIENAEKGVVSVGLTSQISALSGKLDCEIHVINREKSTLKLLGLQIRIASCADSDSAVESTSEFTVLSNAIEQTLEIMDQYSEENIMGKIKSLDGEDSGLDADLLDGKHGSDYATKDQGTKADSAIQGIQGSGTTLTPDTNMVINVTPNNIGAVPNTRNVNNKPLSADITLTASDVGAAAFSHGNHVPTIQTADNKIFLRNDNTWQNVTPENIGAIPTTRTVNEKPLSSDITLLHSDVGAAASSHNHSTSEISSGVFPIERGGTNAATAAEALENLGGVPKTRMINNKALSENILLTASDVGAATTAQGIKADSAIQGVKVNGTLATPDPDKIVNIDATSVNAATAEQGAKADSAIQGIQGNGTTITKDASNIVNITPTDIGAVPTSRTINSKALASNISLTASDVSAAPYEVKSSTDFNSMITPGIYTMRSSSTNSPSGDYNGLIVLKSDNGNYVEQIAVKEGSTQIYLRYLNGSTWSAWEQLAVSNHTHSASNITSGTLPISRGGTGATSASSALSNLGITISSGTWTPAPGSYDGTSPSYSAYYRTAAYYRINDLVYITFYMKVNITNQGSGYACINGLPFTASTSDNGGYALSLREIFGGISGTPASAFIPDSTAMIRISAASGANALQWRTGDTWVSFSGCYIKS